MDLSYSDADEVFRGEVRGFLARHWPPPADADKHASTRTFRSAAVAAGYLYRNVPARYGGSEQAPDIIRAQIIREEFGRALAPMEIVGNGTAMLVPTLIEHGAEWQKERFIRPTIAGAIEWAQGYSEPGAGSDLASVRTRAQLVGNEWIIDGQKIWTTFADRARYMFAVVRTEPAAPKHQGLSYLLIDLRQPGVTIRPLRQMTGDSNFSEIFLDDARTPADWIVGERGAGWTVSRSTLKYERASIGAAEKSQALFGKLVQLARATSRLGTPAINDREVRQKLMVIEAWILAQKYSGYRQFSLAAAQRDTGLIGLMDKLLTTEIGHEIARLAQELIGTEALLAVVPPRAGERRGNARWLNQIIGSLGVAIAGGTSNIQRNIIAERGLGLPRDEDRG